MSGTAHVFDDEAGKFEQIAGVQLASRPFGGIRAGE